MAVLFAKRGAIVVLCDIDEAGNAQTAELISKENALTTNNETRVFAYTCDIGNRDEVHKLVEDIQRDVGDVTMLVNNGLFVNKIDKCTLFFVFYFKRLFCHRNPFWI